MSDIKSPIGFHPLGLAAVLKQYRLAVPSHQREYAWTEKEVVTLFQDFSRSISEQNPNYFVGTIVTIPRSPELLEVIDGQQRLATTAILLAEMRDYLESIKEDVLVESLRNDYLTHTDMKQRARITKMQLNLDDNEYFRKAISSAKDKPEPERDSHRRILSAFMEARKHVAQILSQYATKDHGDTLVRWIKFLEFNAEVILLTVPTSVNAFKMFETLNDRGLKTSQSDLIKNYLFGECSADRLPEAQQKWAFMRGTLESIEEEDITLLFLRHALIAMRGYLKEPELFEVVQSHVRGSQNSIAFMNALENLASLYVAIFNPEHEKWNSYPDSVRRSIQILNLFNIVPFRPLRLAIAAKFNPKETAEAFQKLIFWGVRFLIAASTRTGSVEQAFAKAAQDVFVGHITSAKDLKAQLIGTIPNDEDFRRAFETATVSKAKFARYYLRSLEMTHAGDNKTPWFEPTSDKEAINLEHVLPVKPEEEWPGFREEVYSHYVKRLGNMVLLLAKRNSDLKSDNFKKKKAIYTQESYVLTNQLATVATWNEAAVDARQKILAGLALRAWPL